MERVEAFVRDVSKFCRVSKILNSSYRPVEMNLQGKDFSGYGRCLISNLDENLKHEVHSAE